MRNYLLICFSLFVQITYAQSDFNQHFKAVDSLLLLKQKDKAGIVLENLRYRAFAVENWIAAIKATDKRARLFKKPDQSIEYLDSDTVQLILRRLPKDDLMSAKISILRGYYNDKLGKTRVALEDYEKALAIFESTQQIGASVSYAYHTAGQNALTFIDYEKAEAYFHRAIETDTLERKYHRSCYAHLCMAANFQRKFSTALEYIQLGVQFDGAQEHQFLLNSEAAITYANLAKPSEAKALLNKNNELLQNAKPNFRIKHADDFYRISGQVYDILGESELALQLFQTGVEAAIKIVNGKKSRNLAKHYVRLGDWYFKHKFYPEALDAFHAAMIQVFPNFDETNPLNNPSTGEVKSESFMMTTAKRKIETYLKLYEKDDAIKWLKSAEACIDIAFLGAQNLNATFNDEDAKFYLEHFNAKSLEDAIYCYFLLANNEKDSTYIHKAYHLTEQHKSLVLREGILQNKSLLLSGVPDSLIAKERHLRQQILQTKQKIETLSERRVEQEQLKMQLSILQNQHGFLLAELKKSYPGFVKSMEEASHVELNAIQSKLLDAENILLQYQWGNNYIFIFQINKNNIKLTKIDRSSLDETLNEFLNVLPNRSAQENEPATYYQAAYQLYQQIIEPFIASIDDKVNKMIIVPDGPLSSVPFEALLSESYNGSFTEAPYLLHKFEFQYAYSPSLILQESIEKEKRKGTLAVAPIFANQQRGLSILNQSETEINSIAIPGLEILKGPNASLSAFKNRLKNKQILHLSTHAQANSAKLPPRIEFADTSLYLPSLYSMRIPADLVVLSTCESNLGAYATGEGVMSLSRGFAYAGAESMIASLWAVNENSTAQLFTQYYQQLKNQSKAKSLHLAKLNYLQETKIKNRFKAPYYWAGFIFTGKDGMIEMERSFWGKPMLALFGVFGLLLLFFLNKKFR